MFIPVYAVMVDTPLGVSSSQKTKYHGDPCSWLMKQTVIPLKGYV